MDRGVTCEHLNKLADCLGKDLWESKEALSCVECGCPGPNLWLCLQPDCHHVGCSEVNNDHSTIHQKNMPSHCVHMNISTERVWCYACEREVHVRAALQHAAHVHGPRPAEPLCAGGSSAARLGFDRSVGLNVALQDDDDDDQFGNGDADGAPRGLVGLQNMGNTCYMNAALQALSNTGPLTDYFLECAGAVNVLAGDKKPGLSRSYQKLVKEMWNKKTRGYVVPNGILYGIRNVHPMFRGYHQHDTQEFLRCFMDQLHEELKEPVWDRTEALGADAEGDHSEPARLAVRRRAASSGASEASYLARARRMDGYLRVHSASESASELRASRHRRSASYAGSNHLHSLHSPVLSAAGAASESELSSESEEERYETCSSGASDGPEQPHLPRQKASGENGVGGGDGNGGVRYRSVVSDVFDGRLLSSVQCLICDRVSTRVETFQDLSLPIPSREQLAVLRSQQPLSHSAPAPGSQDSWVWWLVSWFKSWLYGPVVSLQDCLAAFFSADELKGDNMYSCSRCNKLRNGVKMSGVVLLPEVLCVHLKRFRHELMFSAKVGARVAFPLHHLDMAPYTHKECTSKVSRYDLCAVIVHAGTAGGGHYTCVARNPRGWYEFDDQCVTQLSPQAVSAAEAYVLFYRKVNPQMAMLRQKAAEILQSVSSDPNDMKFYISKQWINKFNTWAEPGPIDNGDFVCAHGGVRPDRAAHLRDLAALVPQQLWDFLHDKFGGGPACSHVHECGVCARAAQRLEARRARELASFYQLHAAFQEQERPRAVFAISMHWFRQWQSFVRGNTRQPPPPIDNTGILTKQESESCERYVLKPGSDHAQLSEELWRFFTELYGGGPEVRLKSPSPQPQPASSHAPRPESTRLYQRQSESDREDYCAKANSEMNLRDNTHADAPKYAHSLQNIDRNTHYARHGHTDSDNDIHIHTNFIKYEANGNYDSDEDIETRNFNTVHLENGLDSSDYDANDNPLSKAAQVNVNMESNEAERHWEGPRGKKGGKVRKAKRRAVK